MKGKKKGERARNHSKNFSSLESKSIIKDDKLRLKVMKTDSKEKSKSKPKSKSKTLEKKSKEKEGNYYFVKTSKSKKKHNYDDLCTISKKVSPKKSKDHFTFKEPGSEILPKSQKKSIINQKVTSKKLLSDNRSPKKKNNIYGLQFWFVLITEIKYIANYNIRREEWEKLKEEKSCLRKEGDPWLLRKPLPKKLGFHPLREGKKKQNNDDVFIYWVN